MAEIFWQAVAPRRKLTCHAPRRPTHVARRPTGSAAHEPLAVALTLVAALLLAAAAPLIIAIVFGPAFGAGGLAVADLARGDRRLCGSACLSASICWRAATHSSRRVASGITLGYHPALYLVLVPRFGRWRGAATAIGYLISTLALVIVHRRLHCELVRPLLVDHAGDVATVCAFVGSRLTRRLG